LNKIILIGNGFDLAHKLKTKYNDFINYFWKNEAELLIKEHIKITNDPANRETRPSFFDYKDDFISISNVRYSPKKIQVASTNEEGFHYFKYILSFLGGNLQQNYQIHSLFLEQITNQSFENWVDIEYEYYNSLLECVNGKRKYGIEKLNAEFSNITKALEKYLSIQMENEVVLSDKIKEHIKSIIKPVDVKGYYASNFDDSILILNFNYSNVIERYLNNYFQFCKNNVKCLYIHGQLNNSNNSIIFGYGDELDDNYKLIENAVDNNYLDNVKSIRYSKTRNYKEMLEFIEPAGYEIYIMGHSCGISDKTLLNTLFEHKNCLSINIFYHKINDNTDNYMDIYKNISRIFTDKQKMRKIVLNQPDCLPLIS
jgi:hypothetical protein